MSPTSAHVAHVGDTGAETSDNGDLSGGGSGSAPDAAPA